VVRLLRSVLFNRLGKTFDQFEHSMAEDSSTFETSKCSTVWKQENEMLVLRSASRGSASTRRRLRKHRYKNYSLNSMCE
jgi:hypothetical protein